MVASCMLKPIKMDTITVELTLELVEVNKTNLTISAMVTSTLESQVVVEFYLKALAMMLKPQKSKLPKIKIPGQLVSEFAVCKRLKNNF
jgi:hypothetical protein